MTGFAQDVSFEQDTRRLILWIIASIVAHIVITWGMGLAMSGHQGFHRPLYVELRTVITNEPLANPGTVQEIASAMRAQETSQPLIAPPNPSQTADTSNALNLPLDIYYLSSEVDTRAEPLNEVDLIYPLIPYQQRIRGSVQLNIFVNEQGGIDKVVVVEAMPPGLFEKAALQAVEQLKFSPAIKNGLPVKNRKTIEVNFDPHEKANATSPPIPTPSATEK